MVKTEQNDTWVTQEFVKNLVEQFIHIAFVRPMIDATHKFDSLFVTEGEVDRAQVKARGNQPLFQDVLMELDRREDVGFVGW